MPGMSLPDLITDQEVIDLEGNSGLGAHPGIAYRAFT